MGNYKKCHTHKQPDIRTAYAHLFQRWHFHPLAHKPFRIVSTTTGRQTNGQSRIGNAENKASGCVTERLCHIEILILQDSNNEIKQHSFQYPHKNNKEGNHRIVALIKGKKRRQINRMPHKSCFGRFQKKIEKGRSDVTAGFYTQTNKDNPGKNSQELKDSFGADVDVHDFKF